MTNRILRLANIIFFKYKIAAEEDPLIDPQVSKDIKERNPSQERDARDSLLSLKKIDPSKTIWVTFFTYAEMYNYPPAKFIVKALGAAANQWEAEDLNDPLELLETAEKELVQDIRNGNTAFIADLEDEPMTEDEAPNIDPYSFTMNLPIEDLNANFGTTVKTRGGGSLEGSTGFKSRQSTSTAMDQIKQQAYSKYMLHAEKVLGLMHSVINKLRAALLLPSINWKKIKPQRYKIIDVAAKEAWLDNYGSQFGINDEKTFAMINNSELRPFLESIITRYNRGHDISDAEKKAFKSEVSRLLRKEYNKELVQKQHSDIEVPEETGELPIVEPQGKLQELGRRMKNREITYHEYMTQLSKLTRGRLPGPNSAAQLHKIKNETLRRELAKLQESKMEEEYEEVRRNILRVNEKIKKNDEMIQKFESMKKVFGKNKNRLDEITNDQNTLIKENSRLHSEIERLGRLLEAQSILEHEIDPHKYEGYGDKL